MEEIMRKESGTIEKNEGVQAPEPEHNVERTVALECEDWVVSMHSATYQFSVTEPCHIYMEALWKC